MSQSEPPLTYAHAGVDIDAGNAFVRAIGPLVAATRRPGADGAIGGFGGIFDIAATGYTDPLLVAANDGVGTKLRLAIETGRHDTIGIDLVAMCVNDLVVQGAEPLFFLDYFATGKLDGGVAQAVVAGIAEGCRMAGCALLGGETAEMPGMYAAGDYDLAGFSVGAVERNALLPANIAEADVVLALASSGVHSNGYSLVREIVKRSGLNWADAAPFAPDASLGEALLEPTRIYVEPVLKAIGSGGVHGVAHITGGGLAENFARVLPDGLAAEIDPTAWQRPPVFDWLQRTGGVSDDEMMRAFNCGVGMVLVVEPASEDRVLQVLSAHGETVTRIGTVVPRRTEPVVFGDPR